ncbi:MAG: acyl-CoA dehydrogenase family protein [Myxococcota bacterium]
MNFEFSPEQRAFLAEVDRFLEENHLDEVMDPTRENFAQLVDTPARRAFIRKLGERGWLGITWPKEYGGQDGDGVYEYLLNERLASVGAPQIGKGVGIIGKTLIRHGSEKLKREFLPRILRGEIEFAIGYSEPQAGSDAAAMALRATREHGPEGEGWRLTGQKIFTTSAHFADWYWVGARTDPDAPKHSGISLFLLPMDAPGLTVQSMPTIGEDTTNQVFFDQVWVSDEYRVGELNHGFQYISEALDLERFTLFTFSPIEKRFRLLRDYVRSEVRDGRPLREDPVLRRTIAQLATQVEVARVLGLRFVARSIQGGKPPTVEASTYKLFATQLSQRIADVSLDVAGASGQLRVREPEAPMQGRADSAYRATVVETIGGGSSEIQKNIISRRGLGLPRNF